LGLGWLAGRGLCGAGLGPDGAGACRGGRGWAGRRVILGPGRRSVSKMFGGARGTGMLTAVRVQVTWAMLGL